MSIRKLQTFKYCAYIFFYHSVLLPMTDEK